MSSFSISPFLLHWKTGDISSVEEMRKFLTKFEACVREDERNKLSGFLEGLKAKSVIEFDARIEYLKNEQNLRPDYNQIILELP